MFNSVKKAFRILWVQSFGKALLAAFIYLVFAHLLYNIEFIRSNVGDFAFDTINKFSINTTPVPVEINTSKVLLFGIDDLYMKKHRLYDDDNISNFGYLFPRKHIASFIERVDKLVLVAVPKNKPKALFIDFDVSFTSMPGGEELSVDDQTLVDVLKKQRTYAILLPKTSAYNFIENSEDIEIQKAIDNKKIIFVAVPFLESADGNTRRYKSYQKFNNKEYMGVWLALWQLLHEEEIDINSSKKYFSDHDIIRNRIFIKSYSNKILKNECSVYASYWEQLTKYSANCSFFDIDEDDFSGSILMLGASYTQNTDKFSILSSLSFFGMESSSGIDLHANTLMTMTYLNTSLKQLPIFYSFWLVFISFFFLDWLILFLYNKWEIDHGNSQFFILLLINTFVFYNLSKYLLMEWHLWFNWFMPIILFEVVDIGQRLSGIPSKVKDVISKIKKIT